MILRVTEPPWFKKICDDKDSSKKTFTDLDTLGSIAPCWDPCCMDGYAGKSNTAAIAKTTIRYDIDGGSQNQIKKLYH